jgi:hypothetical protein
VLLPEPADPCKHVLGLLLLWADGEVPVAEVPPFVSDWLQARGERSARPGAPKRSADGAVADPAAREKHVAPRAERTDAGVAELDRWLRDLIRGGLAEAQARPLRAWDETAAPPPTAPCCADCRRRRSPRRGCRGRPAAIERRDLTAWADAAGGA